jgi:hypothetical protein
MRVNKGATRGARLASEARSMGGGGSRLIVPSRGLAADSHKLPRARSPLRLNLCAFAALREIFFVY